MATESVRIPGLRDLMFDNLNHPDPALAEKAADNVLAPVNFGIAAIGDLLFSAATNKDYPPSMDTIGNIGSLLVELAHLSDRVAQYSGMQTFRKELAEAIEQERAGRKVA